MPEGGETEWRNGDDEAARLLFRGCRRREIGRRHFSKRTEGSRHAGRGDGDARARRRDGAGVVPRLSREVLRPGRRGGGARARVSVVSRHLRRASGRATSRVRERRVERPRPPGRGRRPRRPRARRETHHAADVRGLRRPRANSTPPAATVRSTSSWTRSPSRRRAPSRESRGRDSPRTPSRTSTSPNSTPAPSTNPPTPSLSRRYPRSPPRVCRGRGPSVPRVPRRHGPGRTQSRVTVRSQIPRRVHPGVAQDEKFVSCVQDGVGKRRWERRHVRWVGASAICAASPALHSLGEYDI